MRLWCWGPLAATLAAAACARPPTTDQAPAETTPLAAPPPLDHLAPGELVEGVDRAFGLALPRDLNVESRFAQVVFASGAVAVHPVAKYFRARLEGGELQEDDTTATFRHVKMPTRPERELTIRIGQAPRGVRVEIRDSTPPPAPNLPDETARWRNVGLTPQGRVLDPTHLE